MPFSRGHYEEHLCEIIFEFGPVVQEETLFKDISNLELAALSFSRAQPFVQFW